MRKSVAALSIALTTTGIGCMAGHAASNPPATSPAQAGSAAPRGMESTPMEACPMAVPGTQVAVTETRDGEAVTFTTSPDQAGELRARVHAMADMHNRHHQDGRGMEMHGGMHHGSMMGGGSMGSSGGGGDAMAMMPPPSRAAVEDVEGGARLVVTPNDPADLDRLRSTVRMHAERMRQTGTCEINHHGKM